MHMLLSSDSRICFVVVAFPLLGNSDVVALITINFSSFLNRMLLFIADCDGLHNHLANASWGNIFNLNASAAASQSCRSVQVEIDVYVPNQR